MRTVIVESAPKAAEVGAGQSRWRWAQVSGLKLAVVIALGFTLAMSAIITLQVRAYYVTHLPHFDSVGTYTIAYRIINTVARSGFVAGLVEASAVSLTWLQPFYALALAWLPSRSPEWLVSLNFIVMVLVQLAIAVWCRDNQYGWRQATVLMLLPYVPGAFYAWDGGLQDWRRDIQLNLLLVGVLFLSLAYVRRPSWGRGLALGTMLGLTQWSRDNALSMILVVAAPAAVLGLWQALRGRAWWRLISTALLPALVFAAMAGPYYALTIRATIARYLYSVWGPGEDRFASLAQFWVSPVDVLLGGTTAYNGMAATGRATLIALVLTGLLIAGGLGVGVLHAQPRRLLAARSQILTWSGVGIVIGVIVYNTLGLGYGAQYHGMPFVPVAVGIVALAAGLSDAVTARGGGRRQEALRTAALLVSVVGLLGLNAYRVRANQFSPAGAETVADVRDASVLISDLATRGPVAVLWLNGFSRFHIAYYQAQAGRTLPPVTATEIEGPLRAGQRVEDVLGPLEAQVRERAAVVVVCEDTTYYADPQSIAPFFREGKPIVDRLLSDPSFRIVHRFRVDKFPIVVLERRAAASGESLPTGGGQPLPSLPALFW